MGSAIGTVLPLAVAVAIFPIPVVASVLVVGTDRGRLKGLAFVSGWLAGLVLVGGAVLAIGGAAGEGDDGAPATWTSLVVLTLGLVLLALATRTWRGRPDSGESADGPGWMKTIDNLPVGRVGGLGFALSGLNPKNILLTIAAAVEIGYFELNAGEAIVVLAMFVLIASAGVLTPLVLVVALGERAAPLLETLRDWMARNNAAVMAVLFAVIGAKLIGDAISGLSA